MTTLAPQAAQEKLKSGQASLIDVRTEAEFRSGHVLGAVNVPLDKIPSFLALLPKDRSLILQCQAGIRSAKAMALLEAEGFKNTVEMEGGLNAWAAAGLPVNQASSAIPIFRQVLFTAGLCTLTGTLLAITVHPGFLAVPLFFGAGLTFAGATGWCGLAMLLERMPWNSVSKA